MFGKDERNSQISEPNGYETFRNALQRSTTFLFDIKHVQQIADIDFLQGANEHVDANNHLNKGPLEIFFKLAPSCVHDNRPF